LYLRLICRLRFGTVDYADSEPARHHHSRGTSQGYLNSSGYTNGFLYNGTSYTTLSVPGATQTYAQGINSNNIVGYYENSSGNIEGFLATPVPEPSILEVLAVGVAAFIGYWRDGRREKFHRNLHLTSGERAMDEQRRSNERTVAKSA
jgi:hypothetical protein